MQMPFHTIARVSCMILPLALMRISMIPVFQDEPPNPDREFSRGITLQEQPEKMPRGRSQSSGTVRIAFERARLQPLPRADFEWRSTSALRFGLDSQ
jgi:hypothetical protein